MNPSEIREKLKQYKFYHVIKLAEGLETPGVQAHVESQQPVLRAIASMDLKDKRVLDIGCRDGLYSFEAEHRGAREVIGIDNDLSTAAVEFLIPCLKSSVKMYERNLYDAKPAEFGTFDVVIFAGVLYHLRYPMWGLKAVRDLCSPGALVLLETAVMHGFGKHAMLYCPVGGDGPYNVDSPTFFNKKGLIDTLNSIGLRTLSYAALHPDAEKKHQHGNEPVVDRALLICQRYEIPAGEPVEGYWHATHHFHSEGQPAVIQRPLHARQ